MNKKFKFKINKRNKIYCKPNHNCYIATLKFYF